LDLTFVHMGIKMDLKHLSDVKLIVVGGVAHEAKSIHVALKLLNQKKIFRIEQICSDGLSCFFYYQLIHNVYIFKSVSKMAATVKNINDKSKK